MPKKGSPSWTISKDFYYSMNGFIHILSVLKDRLLKDSNQEICQKIVFKDWCIKPFRLSHRSLEMVEEDGSLSAIKKEATGDNVNKSI